MCINENFHDLSSLLISWIVDVNSSKVLFYKAKNNQNNSIDRTFMYLLVCL